MAEDVKYILFDLYDTLLYIGKKNNTYAKLFNEFDLNSIERKVAKDYVLKNNFDNLDEFIEKASVKFNRDIKDLDISKYRELLAEEVDSVKLYSETLDTLSKLKTQGYKLGLISNLATPFVKPFYSTGIDHMFDAVLLSCFRNMKKPEIPMYCTALKEISRSNQIGEDPIAQKYICDLEDKSLVDSFGCNTLRCHHDVVSMTIMIGDNRFYDTVIPYNLGIDTIHIKRNGKSPAPKSIKNLNEIFAYL